MRSIAGKKNIFSKFFFGIKDDELFNYEISFDGGDYLILPSVLSNTDWVIGFDFSFASNATNQYLLQISDSTNVSGGDDFIVLISSSKRLDLLISNTAFDDQVSYTSGILSVNTYYSLKIQKTGSNYKIYFAGNLVLDYDLVGDIDFTNRDLRFIGCNNGVLPILSGGKIKNMYGAIAPMRMFSDDAGTTLCTPGSKIAKVSSVYSGDFWTQTDNLKRPTMVAATPI